MVAAERAADEPGTVINCPLIPAAEKAASRAAIEGFGIEDLAAEEDAAAEVSTPGGRAAAEAAEVETDGRVAITSYQSVYHFFNTSLLILLVSPSEERTCKMKDLFSYRHSPMSSKKGWDPCTLFKM